MRQYLRQRAGKEAEFLQRQLNAAGGLTALDDDEDGAADSSDADSDNYDLHISIGTVGESPSGRTQPVRTARQWIGTLRKWKHHLLATYRASLLSWASEHEEHRTQAGCLTDEGKEACTKDLFGNPLQFWEYHRHDAACRELYVMAATCFSIPATECASERVFKRMKRLATKERANLDEEKLEQQAIIGLNAEQVGLQGVDVVQRLVRELQE